MSTVQISSIQSMYTTSPDNFGGPRITPDNFGGPRIPPAQLTLNNVNTPQLNWTAIVGYGAGATGWLQLPSPTPVGGNSSIPFTVNVNTTQLPTAGTYTATVNLQWNPPHQGSTGTSIVTVVVQ
jgi:hypothetical protein